MKNIVRIDVHLFGAIGAKMIREGLKNSSKNGIQRSTQFSENGCRTKCIINNTYHMLSTHSRTWSYRKLKYESTPMSTFNVIKYSFLIYSIIIMSFYWDFDGIINLLYFSYNRSFYWFPDFRKRCEKIISSPCWRERNPHQRWPLFWTLTGNVEPGWQPLKCTA